VIALEARRTAERVIRYLSVRKMRGSTFRSGDHVYRITAGGLVVFPRLADVRDDTSYESNGARASTGIAALDDALEDGYAVGSTTLIAGPSGAGKTIMGLHFVFAGAARDEPGVYVTLQENRMQLARIISRFGWSIDDPMVSIMDRSPVDLYVDELVYELLERVQAVGARRLVVDSLNDLVVATADHMRLREFLYSLVQRCARQGVSLMFTYETVELFRITRLSELGMSHISDNVVLLQHIHEGTEMKRALTVLKSRGSMTSSAIREFKIAADGITLGEPFSLGSLGR
jgi:circadian clock protein KaiC